MPRGLFGIEGGLSSPRGLTMDEISFKKNFLPLHAKLYACAFAILRDENDAKDCIQEAFTRFWKNRHKLDDVNNLLSYAIITVRNIAITMLSDRGRILALEESTHLMADARPPDELTADRDNLRVVTELLGHLPEAQRKVILMSAFGGLSNTEISDAVNLSEGNVRVLLSRGRKKLRELFSKSSTHDR